MTPFEEEMTYLEESKKEASKEEYIQIMMRQTEMFLKLAKILENDTTTEVQRSNKKWGGNRSQ